MTSTLSQAAGLFTVPALAAIGAAAIAIPVIIHLMSRFRRRPEPWGAMRFLLEAYKKQRKRLQLERLLLLLVRCLVVLLAGLALFPITLALKSPLPALTPLGSAIVSLQVLAQLLALSLKTI